MSKLRQPLSETTCKAFVNLNVKSFNGKCLAIIRLFIKSGSIIVTTESEGLPPAAVEITTQYI